MALLINNPPPALAQTPLLGLLSLVFIKVYPPQWVVSTLRTEMKIDAFLTSNKYWQRAGAQ